MHTGLIARAEIIIIVKSGRNSEVTSAVAILVVMYMYL